jgi:hypothetical protein
MATVSTIGTSKHKLPKKSCGEKGDSKLNFEQLTEQAYNPSNIVKNQCALPLPTVLFISY